MTSVSVEGRAEKVVYVDFGEALDKVLLGKLIQKIKIHGIHGDLVV